MRWHLDVILATDNVDEFERVPQLQIENWLLLKELEPRLISKYNPLWNELDKPRLETTHLLEKAFFQASQLPELQQNILAKWIIEKLIAEKKWDSLFAESEDLLAELADEALNEYEQGKTQVCA